MPNPYFENLQSIQQTKALDLANQEAQLNLEARQRMLARLGQGQPGVGGQQPGQQPGGQPAPAPAPGQIDAVAKAVDDMARAAAEAGYVDKAAQLAEKGAQIRSHMALAAKNAGAAQLQELRIVQGLTEGVNDQAGLDRANAVYEMTTGKPSPLKGVPYSPDLSKNLRNMVTTVQDRALAAERTSKEVESKARIPLIKAQTNLANARAAAAAKAGSKPTARIAANTKLASSMVMKDFQGISSEEAYIYGRRIAERAADLTFANPALKDSEATAQAYNQLKATGTFAAFNARAAHAGTLERPATIPEDSSKLVKDRYYVNASGVKARWTGKGFSVVQPEDTGAAADNEDEGDQ